MSVLGQHTAVSRSENFKIFKNLSHVCESESSCLEILLMKKSIKFLSRKCNWKGKLRCFFSENTSFFLSEPVIYETLLNNAILFEDRKVSRNTDRWFGGGRKKNLISLKYEVINIKRTWLVRNTKIGAVISAYLYVFSP